MPQPPILSDLRSIQNLFKGILFMLNNSILKLFVAMLLCSGLSVQADNYAGIGLGQSMFDPDGISLDDDKDNAWALFLGSDLTENWSGEFYYHDLGSAEAVDNIDFSVVGLDGIYHFPNSSDKWSVYGRAGIARVSADVSNGSPISSADGDSNELGYGLGVRWNNQESWFSRLEYRGYGDEVSAIFLTAALKFGGSDSSKSAEPKAVATVKDTDGDGVPDKADKCPDTKQGVNVDEKGCDKVISKAEEKAIVAKLDLKGITFKSNSNELTAQSSETLDAAAQALVANSTIKLEIQAHTDSAGSDDHNMNLSSQRANTVKSYLVGKGVEESRLTAKGYGETTPIADNNTAEGRAANRRVEFKVIE